MGQKVNPIIFRTGIPGGLPWASRWFSKGYADFVLEDIKIRAFLFKEYAHTKIGSIEIERSGDFLKIIIKSGMPGILIGKKGQDIDTLRKRMAALLKEKKYHIEVSILEIKEPLLIAKIVAQGIADQLERRVGYKKAIKKAATEIMRAGAVGLKIRVSGRLDGAEIAREEWEKKGSVPLHTLRANIEYGTAEAATLQGIVGVKVWINRGVHRSNI